MLPFLTSFLLRVYAWKGILADQGVLNNFLVWLGVVEIPIQMLPSDFSMLIGMTYVYIPFMILPIYATMAKMDSRYLEAAFDLGARPWQAFWLVTVPLSKSGIVAGSMLVFIPCVGEFVIPSLLGGAENYMVGRSVWDALFEKNNWSLAASLAVVMVMLILIPVALYNHYSAEQDSSTEG
jgi:putrescine transport system permease protein